MLSAFLWKHTDSNRGPSRCKRDALNQLSYASLFLIKIILSNYFWCPEQESNLHSVAETRF